MGIGRLARPLAVLGILVTAGCGSLAPTPESAPASDAGAQPGAASPAVGAVDPPDPTSASSPGAPSMSTGPVENPQSVVVAPVPVIGTASGTPDSARSAKAIVGDGDTPAVLSVKDGTGATWTLTVPPFALDAPTEITMSPLADIDADLPGPLVGGVELGPAGTVFLVPATLTVAHPKKTSLDIVTGDDRGDVRYAEISGDTWGSVLIRHFSGGYSLEPDDPAWSRATASLKADYLAAAAEAEELLKQKGISLPPVPTIRTGCDKSEQAEKAEQEQIDAFVTAVAAPEYDIMVRILAYWKRAQLYDLEPTSWPPNDLVGRLMERYKVKASKLLDSTKGKPDQAVPAATAALHILRNAALLGVNIDDEMKKVAAWADTIVDGAIKQLREQHDYQQVDAIWRVHARMSALLGGTQGDLAEFTGKIDRALTFTAKVTLSIDADNGKWRLVEAGELKSTGAGGALKTLFGQGIGDVAEFIDPENRLTYANEAFKVKMGLERIDYCEGTGVAALEHTYYPDDERYLISPGGGDMIWGGTYIGWLMTFGQHPGRLWKPVTDPLTMTPMYGFDVRVENKDPLIVDQKFISRGGGQTMVIEFQILHTPR